MRSHSSGEQDDRGWKAGDRRETEIRACSIWGVELLKKEVAHMIKSGENGPCLSFPINSVMIDFFLWTHAKKMADDIKGIPIHLVRTHYY